MKKIEDYQIKTLDVKHSEDCIHGYDPVYDIAFDTIKKTVDDAKQTQEYADKSNVGFVGTIDEMDKAIKTIENSRKGNYDQELIENYIRSVLKVWSIEYNEIVEELKMNKDQ